MKIKIPVEYEIKESDLYDLLVTAVEGGIGYWACITGYRGEPADPEDPRYMCILNGGAMQISDAENLDNPAPDFAPIWVDKSMLERGLQVMAEKQPRHFRDFIDENYDSCTADVWFQLATLGDVVYG